MATGKLIRSFYGAARWIAMANCGQRAARGADFFLIFGQYGAIGRRSNQRNLCESPFVPFWRRRFALAAVPRRWNRIKIRRTQTCRIIRLRATRCGMSRFSIRCPRSLTMMPARRRLTGTALPRDGIRSSSKVRAHCIQRSAYRRITKINPKWPAPGIRAMWMEGGKPGISCRAKLDSQNSPPGNLRRSASLSGELI